MTSESTQASNFARTSRILEVEREIVDAAVRWQAAKMIVSNHYDPSGRLKAAFSSAEKDLEGAVIALFNHSNDVRSDPS